jgi:hypothetical protein
MDRDSFIIAVFLLVCEQYGVIRQQCRLRRGGFEPGVRFLAPLELTLIRRFKLSCAGYNCYRSGRYEYFFY